MADRINITIDEHVAIVTLNRPDKHNAVDIPMFEALSAAGTKLASDTRIRAIVLEGAGPSFCAGIDTGIFRPGGDAIAGDRMAAGEETPANFFQRAAYVWREIPVPVLCAMHGTVFGAGLQIALGADIRFCSPDCRLSIMEISWGIIPDMAISTVLPRLLPLDRIKELAWSGRVLTGAEAHEFGLVTVLHAAPGEAAREAARAMAGRSPEAIRAIKRLFDTAAELPVAEALALEARLQASLLGQPNQLEAVMAKLENRAPKFRDPST